ncbi:MAG: aminodeoxychorismate/anthranilate synthase component II [Fidelibacterota bacterium]|nr:MAG: aminodeoxychorismate/anthranilate synthase component II [Candidatus Neomarinimicrobiota bacterium]
MILILDNYDSFTYNLVQYVGEYTDEVEVIRNDACSLEDLSDRLPDKIIISPGPGRPENAGLSIPLVEYLGSAVPILGVCLGHQSIAAAYGGQVIQAPEILHGKTSEIDHDGSRLLDGLPCPLRATRYHSLVVDEASLPNVLKVTARSEIGLIMGIEHWSNPVAGFQFHPESILTEHGLHIIENFLKRFP